MIKYFLFNSMGFLILLFILPNSHIPEYNKYYHLIMTSCISGLIFSTIKPILKFFTFPMFFLTLGFWFIIINIATFWITVSIVNKIGLYSIPGDLHLIFKGVLILYISRLTGNFFIKKFL